MKRSIVVRAAWLGVLLLGLCAVMRPGAGAASPTTEEWRWSATGRLNEARYDHTATLLADGRVLVAGGVSGSGITASAEVYDPATGAWTAVMAMGTPRREHTATRLAGGRVLVAGGRTAGGEVLHSAELFDPATGQWSAAGRMGSGRAGHAAVLLADGDVLVSGGEDEYETKSFSERYHPATGVWTWAGAMQKERVRHAAAPLLDGRVLLVGGYRPGNVAELFDPAVDAWRYTGGRTLDFPGWLAAVPLADGRVLAVGESGSSLFDPVAESWEILEDLPWRRVVDQAAATMGDGRAMVSGGYDTAADVPDGSGYLDATWVFDPASGEWRHGGNMSQPRAGHTATRLLDGRVLIAGGWSFGALDSAELYAPFERPYAIYVPSVVWTGE